MGIQDDSEAPVEVSVMKTPHLETKKYVIVKNHVKELNIPEHAASANSSSQEDSSENEKSAKKAKKSSKKDIKIVETTTRENAFNDAFKHTSDKLEEIRKELEEFRKEFQECFNRLGAKLENIVQKADPGPSTHKHNLANVENEEGCQCKVNTKIIFDENGQQSVAEPTIENHVCQKKLKRKYSDVAKNIDIHDLVMAQKAKVDRNLAVEYEEQNITLPDDLASLSNILQDSSIALSYRNKVIDKVKLIKQEHINSIRFNKPAMVQELKADSKNNDWFEFKGANLQSLPGYPDWK